MTRESLLRTRSVHFCHYCRIRLTPGVNLTVDHIVPRSKGGTSHHKNLAACCVDCNVRKADERWHEDCARCKTAWRRFGPGAEALRRV